MLDTELAVVVAQNAGALSRRPSVCSTHSHAELRPEASLPEIGLSSHRPELEHRLLSDRLDLDVRALAVSHQTQVAHGLLVTAIERVGHP